MQTPTMDESYVRRYPEMERTHFWWRIRQRIASDFVEDLDGDVRLLDVGCGSGVTLEVVESLCSSVAGVEIDPLAVQPSSKMRDRIAIGTLDQQQFDPGSFDVVLLMDVIEHVADPSELLLEVERVLRPGGRLLVTVPAFPFLWSQHDVINHHHRRYRRKQLIAELEAGGLRVEVCGYFFMFLMIPKLVFKVLGLSESTAGSPSGRLHRLLYRISALEYRIFRGAPGILMAGTSLIAFASKDDSGAAD